MAHGLARGTVRLVEHDPDWAAVFKAEAYALQAVLRRHRIAAQIQHVGSTAVQGMPAKPIIDIAVGVPSADDVGGALVALRAAGRDYVKAANQPGMLFLALGDAERLFHYHLVVAGSHAWDRLVFFRDVLRRHRGLAKEYAELKQRLAERFPQDRGAYTRGKSAYVRAVESRAFNEERRRMQARTIAEAVRRDTSVWPMLRTEPPGV
ncbi:GrpB family protein [Streptomyces sp. NPDC004065]|uniref:GrpB family protein n=1 Tax=Streptomyces sp. NPDC004065 TaxID=3364689 RepID=UPI00384A563C